MSSTMETVLEKLINSKPGIPTAQLFQAARDWYGKLWQVQMTAAFERALWDLRERGYRVTNKLWYPAGHVAAPRVHKGPKPHPKQTRMDW